MEEFSHEHVLEVRPWAVATWSSPKLRLPNVQGSDVTPQIEELLLEFLLISHPCELSLISVGAWANFCYR